MTSAAAAATAALVASHRCHHAFFDVGANIGVQTRKLFQPKYYAGAGFVKIFHKHFGDQRECRVCAILIEPNPHHALRLQSLQERYRAAGAAVLVIHAAAGTLDGSVSFHTTSATKADTWNDVAATTSAVWRGMEARGFKYNQLNASVTVPVIDLAQIIHRVRSSLVGVTGQRDASRIVMKLDIESSEYTVVPHLVEAALVAVLAGVLVSC